MTIHKWKNHRIEVFSRAVAKHLWCSVCIGVRVDDGKIFQSSENFHLKDSLRFEFVSDGKTIESQLITIPPSAVIFTRYRLIVDNTEIERGGVRANNWYVLYFLICAIFVGVFMVA